MKEFWCVMSRFFDNGRVQVVTYLIEAEKMPEQQCIETARFDEYRDYFKTYAEARDYEQDCKRA